jgi:hypothetical protein
MRRLDGITETKQKCQICNVGLDLRGKSSFCQYILNRLDYEFDNKITKKYRVFCRGRSKFKQNVCISCFQDRTNALTVIKNREIKGNEIFPMRPKRENNSLSIILSEMILQNEYWLHSLYKNFFLRSGFTCRAFCDCQYTIRYLMRQKEKRNLDDYIKFYEKALRKHFKVRPGAIAIWEDWDIVSFVEEIGNREMNIIYVS